MERRRRSVECLRRSFPGLALAALVACTSAQPDAPNVLLILADDLGYGELGAYGRADAGTPSIDRLAAEGVRFARHYAHSSCAPARAALLTGRHPARAGFRARGRALPAEVATLAERLRDRGYATRHLGKWHLGGTGIWGLDTSPPSAAPSAHGFDHWFGFLDSWLLNGPGDGTRQSQLAPEYRGGRYLSPWLLGSEAPGAVHPGHLTDLLTDHAIRFIRGPHDAPWLLNLWYLAPHGPLQPHLRFAERHPNTPAGRRRALVQQLDEDVGRVLTALEQSGQARRTLVVLLSDNGAPAHHDPRSNAPFAGGKTELNEGGLRTPLLLRYTGRIDPAQVVEAPVSILDVLPTIARFTGAAASDVDGRDLAPLLAGASLPERPLYWEQALPDGTPEYSVLSGDGRFRLTGGLGASRLLDLDADPTGATDVIEKQPETAAALLRQHRAWRREALRVPVQRVGSDDRGRGLVTGSDPLRSPGWGGFTFAVGVIPDPRAAPPEREELIAQQPGVWELTRNPRNALRVRLAGVELKGRKLREGECNAVVVTGHFNVSARDTELNAGNLTLFLDGVAQDTAQRVPLPTGTDLASPTLLGLASDAHDALRGQLGAPIFLSARVVAEGDGPEGSAEALGDELCPPAS